MDTLQLLPLPLALLIFIQIPKILGGMCSPKKGSSILSGRVAPGLVLHLEYCTPKAATEHGPFAAVLDIAAATAGAAAAGSCSGGNGIGGSVGTSGGDGSGGISGGSRGSSGSSSYSDGFSGGSAAAASSDSNSSSILLR